MTRVAAVLCLVACTSDQGWPGATGVGNPGSAAQRVAGGGDVVIDRASVYTKSFEVMDCAGGSVEVEIEEDIDLMYGLPVTAPGGPWCGLAMYWEPPLLVEGQADEGGSFTLELQTEGPSVTITPWFLMNEHALILEIGFHEWFKKEELDLHRLDDVVVDRTHPLHDALSNRATDGSGLYIDADGSGELDPSERTQPLGAGPLHEVDDS